MIWDGTSEDIDEWLDKVFGDKKGNKNTIDIPIKLADVEG